ncbi:peptide ABC transporter substrate-binding protein [Neoactinobaculum massilliense]|uniref:peptide ABC transporter substrate-binding protein n=1 Tax=Neoactinobaculum massilliense TaxID=2364794 RepID=UPI000F522BD9|nr:ABC transporter substrate-binding protein [Neoactinobaculum massilliense]
MKLKKALLAIPAALALTLSACSGGSGASSATSDSNGTSTGVVTVNGSEPQNPLIPANTNEVGGGKIEDLIFSGLVYYDAKGATHNDMAESIESSDNQNWTIKLKKGQKFTDGTEVQAHNFVDAWKAGAKEAMLSSYFYGHIQGAADDGTGDLTGVKEVDDYTFTVALKDPEADFPLQLGYAAFYPLPDSTLKDSKTGGEHPVGNGPYKLASDNAWQHNVRIDLVPNPDYKGDRQPKNGGVSVIFYSSTDAAYSDLLAGNLDVLDAIPASSLGSFQDDLGDRAVNQPAAIWQSISISENAPHFSGEEGKLRRQAISMAIDRDSVTKTIFYGTRTPAKDFTSPVIDGYNDALSGSDVLSYNADKAKELWAKADAISPWSGQFSIAYNSDGDHQAWVDAVCNSIKNTLGIDAAGKPYPDFKSLRDDITNGKVESGFRTGWQADYPGKYNFLAPLYGTGAGSNDAQYSSAEFDGLLTKASAASSVDESNKILDQAQELLLQDLPAIPLWYSNVTGGYADTVSNVAFGWNSVPIYEDIVKN